MLKRRSEVADDRAAFRAKKFAASPESGSAVTPSTGLARLLRVQGH